MAQQQFDIYGMGNALLDMEYDVNDQQLAQLGIEKGVMTLVEAERQQQLRQQCAAPKVIASGGSIANSMVTASQLGARCHFSCRVAADKAGQDYLANLQQAAVQTNPSQAVKTAKSTDDHRVDSDEQTGTCMAFITPDGERSMLTHLGVSAKFGVSDIDVQRLAASRLLYIGGYLVASEVSMEAVLLAISAAKKAGVQIALSLADVNMVKFFRPQLTSILQQGIDILFANKDELALYTGQEQAAQQCAAMAEYAQEILMTAGAEGVYAYNGGMLQHTPGRVVTVIDTLGAGDAFAGAYLASKLSGRSILEAAQFANHVASCMVAKRGPRFSVDEIAALRQQHEAA